MYSVIFHFTFGLTDLEMYFSSQPKYLCSKVFIASASLAPRVQMRKVSERKCGTRVCKVFQSRRSNYGTYFCTVTGQGPEQSEAEPGPAQGAQPRSSRQGILAAVHTDRTRDQHRCTGTPGGKWVTMTCPAPQTSNRFANRWFSASLLKQHLYFQMKRYNQSRTVYSL